MVPLLSNVVKIMVPLSSNVVKIMVPFSSNVVMKEVKENNGAPFILCCNERGQRK